MIEAVFEIKQDNLIHTTNNQRWTSFTLGQKIADFDSFQLIGAKWFVIPWT